MFGMKLASLSRMKQYIYIALVSIIALNITSCGSSGSAPQAPTPSSSPSTVPESSAPVVQLDQALVGNWIDMTGNTLAFKADGTALSKSQKLTWSIDLSNKINFEDGAIPIDSCSYEILTSGGLNTSLLVTLDMGCNKSGELTYTSAP